MATRPLSSTQPISHNAQKPKKQLGSMCPTILKHEFPNDSSEYINDVMQEVTSTQKRFRYNRPMTAKSNISAKFSQTMPLMSAGANRPQTAFAQQNQQQQQPSRLEGLSSADLYKKLLKNQGKQNEKRFQIKPQKTLNTLNIHSALYKVKKQKEYLDQKIHELEQKNTNFNETDFYIIANAGAMDYILNTQQQQQDIQQQQQQQVSPLQKSSTLSASNNQNLQQQNTQGSLSTKSAVPRPKTAKKRIPEYLKPDPNDDLTGFDIIGNASKTFKEQIRGDIENWGSKNNENDQQYDEEKENQRQIKDNIENQMRNSENIQFLMASVEQNEQEEMLQEQLQQQLYQQLQQQTQIQQQMPSQQQYNNNQIIQQQINEIREEDEHELQNQQNDLLLQQKQQELFLEQQKEQQQQQQQKILPNRQFNNRQRPMSSQGVFGGGFKRNNSFQQQQQQQSQQPFMGQTLGVQPTGAVKGFSKTFTSDLRPMSAASVMGETTPLSNTVNSRPQTAKNAPLHAAMSFGQASVVKQRVTRNFDHLELIRKKKEFDQEKLHKKQQKRQFKRNHNLLEVVGQGMEVVGDAQRFQRLGNQTSINRVLSLGSSQQFRQQMKRNSYQEQSNANNNHHMMGQFEEQQYYNNQMMQQQMAQQEQMFQKYQQEQQQLANYEQAEQQIDQQQIQA